MDLLLLFARLPRLGTAKTRLAAGMNGDGRGDEIALKIHTALLDDALRAGRGAGCARRLFFHAGAPGGGSPELPLEGWELHPQSEGGLGERLRDAAARAFARGAATVTLYGSDHPLLDCAALDRVTRHARAGACGVIPTSDGGFAALALPAPLPELFTDVRWSTPDTLADTLRNIATAGRTAVLEPATPDIDTAADWLALYDKTTRCSGPIRAIQAELLPPPPGKAPAVAVIVPVRNESAELDTLIPHLRGLGADELICVDGNSSDGTPAALRAAGLRVLDSAPGRAAQMNAGALAARADALLFLHADTRLPTGWKTAVRAVLEKNPAGRFAVRVQTPRRRYRLLSAAINLHSRLKGIATGDQAIFLSRRFFHELGGFPVQPLMEDIELCKRMKRRGARIRPAGATVITSGRRWESRGFWKTVFLMWKLRYRYWRGAPADELALLYA